MITMAKLNPHGYPTNSEQQANLSILCDRLNQLSEACNMEFKINSGLRSDADQKAIIAAGLSRATRSKHLIGAAADIADEHNLIYSWCQNNMEIVAAIGLWMESVLDTKTWIHLQMQPPKSGKRVFRA